jgi:hypothetical protein
VAALGSEVFASNQGIGGVEWLIQGFLCWSEEVIGLRNPYNCE